MSKKQFLLTLGATMALSKSKLSKIAQRNKDLAFGYVHEKERENNMSVPDFILIQQIHLF